MFTLWLNPNATCYQFVINIQTGRCKKWRFTFKHTIFLQLYTCEQYCKQTKFYWTNLWMNRKHAYLYIIYISIDMRASVDRCRAEFRGAGPDQCRLYPERHHYCRREDGPCDRQQGPVQAITAWVPIQGLRGAQEVRGQPRHVWQLAPQVQEADGNESEAGKSPVRFHHRPPGGARGRNHVSVEVRDIGSLVQSK